MSELQLMGMCCAIADCCKRFSLILRQRLLQPSHGTRLHQPALALSDLMTIMVALHWNHYRTFKHSSTADVVPHLRPYFPTLVSDTRCVEPMLRVHVPLCCYPHTRKGRWTGIAFIDAPPLTVCHDRCIASHKVFANWAARGKRSMGGVRAANST